jgi:iron complex transport system substrate-binding protein
MAVRPALILLLLTPLALRAAPLPTVASINLCADQLVLTLADPAQILSVSWLAADTEESMLAETAQAFPRNYGAAEEIIALDPAVVVAGSFTNAYTRRLLRELGYTVVDVEPAESIADIERNLDLVGKALGRSAAAADAIAGLRAAADAIAARRPDRPPRAIVLRPGGFTVGADSLASELLTLAGIINIAAASGLDRWGSLSVEALLESAPDLLILADYRRDEPSLANLVFMHPALAELGARVATVGVESRYWACGLPQSLRSAEIIQARLRASAQ